MGALEKWSARAVLFLVLAITICPTAARDRRRSEASNHASGNEELRRIALVQAYPRWDWEVVFGLLYTLNEAAINYDLFLVDALSHFNGAEKILSTLHAGAWKTYPLDLFDSLHDYDTIIYTDWYGSHIQGAFDPYLPEILSRSHGYEGNIFMFVHEAGYLWHLRAEHTNNTLNRDPAFQRSTKQVYTDERVQFLTIAPHTARNVTEILHDAGIKKNAEWLCPVFKLTTSSAQDEGRENGQSVLWAELQTESLRGFGIQGKVEQHRRDYAGLLSDLNSLKDVDRLVADPRFRVETIGKGKIKNVPPKLKPTIVARSGLSYEEYYAEIRSCIALLTLFPGQRYFTEASSSTVATALSTGVPLIVEPQFLEIYDFIPPAAVVVARGGNFAEGMKAVLDMDEVALEKLRKGVAAARDATITRNVQQLKKVLEIQ